MITERPGNFNLSGLHRALDTMDQLRPMPGVSRTTQGTWAFSDSAWPVATIGFPWDKLPFGWKPGSTADKSPVPKRISG